MMILIYLYQALTTVTRVAMGFVATTLLRYTWNSCCRGVQIAILEQCPPSVPSTSSLTKNRYDI